jgi:hypothetical protein
MNPFTMALWGLIVAGSLAIGFLLMFAGLAVVVPVLAHSTWHLYRKGRGTGRPCMMPRWSENSSLTHGFQASGSVGPKNQRAGGETIQTNGPDLFGFRSISEVFVFTRSFSRKSVPNFADHALEGRDSTD